MNMATSHPLYIAECAVKVFVTQWISVLTPSLRISTKSDGFITVKSEIASFIEQDNFPATSSCCRSGMKAHHRRRKACTVSPDNTSTTSSSGATTKGTQYQRF